MDDAEIVRAALAEAKADHVRRMTLEAPGSVEQRHCHERATSIARAMDAFDRLAAEVARLKMGREWRPISEAPDVGDFLIELPRRGKLTYEVCHSRRIADGKILRTAGAVFLFDYSEQPTRFLPLPLPQPPEAG